MLCSFSSESTTTKRVVYRTRSPTHRCIYSMPPNNFEHNHTARCGSTRLSPLPESHRFRFGFKPWKHIASNDQPRYFGQDHSHIHKAIHSSAYFESLVRVRDRTLCGGKDRSAQIVIRLCCCCWAWNGPILLDMQFITPFLGHSHWTISLAYAHRRRPPQPRALDVQHN